MSVTHDALTGLQTRVALDGALKGFVDRGDDVAVAFLDVDRFLEVNTALGHEAGDRLLRALAELLEAEAPGHAYRISGDEFGLLFPGASLEQAFLRMEALRARVEAAARDGQLGLDPSAAGGGSGATTITIGVAQYPRDGKNADELLKNADAALLAAKEGSRNAVGLPPNEEMVMKSCYYAAGSVRKLRALAERLSRKESLLLREALNDLLRKYDVPREA